jgi:hypothetical protein
VLTIVAILLSFLLTGVTGNMLLQRWQYRSWLNQQRFLGQEKEFQTLSHLCDELAELSGIRYSRMQRLFLVIRSSDSDLVKERLTSYSQAVEMWNERLPSLTVRLFRLTPTSLANGLEHGLQPKFVTVGRELERIARKRLNDSLLETADLVHLGNALNQLSAVLIDFNRKVLANVQVQKRKTYDGVTVQLNEFTIPKFRNWELFKALFHSGIQPFSVTRPPFDFELPGGGRI